MVCVIAMGMSALSLFIQTDKFAMEVIACSCCCMYARWENCSNWAFSPISVSLRGILATTAMSSGASLHTCTASKMDRPSQATPLIITSSIPSESLVFENGPSNILVTIRGPFDVALERKIPKDCDGISFRTRMTVPSFFLDDEQISVFELLSLLSSEADGVISSHTVEALMVSVIVPKK